MHLIRCLLTLLSFTAHAAGAAEMAQMSALDKKFYEVEKARMMQLATEGVSERDALMTIGIYFPSKADQAYLNAKWPKPSEQVLKVRSITAIGDEGVSVTMPNGRSFTATKDAKGNLLINKQVVSTETAEKFFTELNRALKTTFVTQNFWLRLLGPQEAQAQVGEIALICAGIVGLAWGGVYLREKNLSKLPSAEATAKIWADSCEKEKSELKTNYDYSTTRKLSRAIEAKTELGNLLRKFPVDCVKVAHEVAWSGASSHVEGDEGKLCESMMKFKICNQEYQTASAAKFDKGAPSAPAPEAAK